MASKKSAMPLCCLLLLVLLLPSVCAEATIGAALTTKYCAWRSDHFSGLCIVATSCSKVCRDEGYTNGMCQQPDRDCYCIKPCTDQPGSLPASPSRSKMGRRV